MRRRLAAPALFAALAGCGTPSTDRTDVRPIASLCAPVARIVSTSRVDVATQLKGWPVVRATGNSQSVLALRRGGDAVEIERFVSGPDGTVHIEGTLRPIPLFDPQGLDRTDCDPPTGVYLSSGETYYTRDPAVSWSRIPNWFHPGRIQVEGDFLCLEDQVHTPLPPPCGDSYGVVKVLERRDGAWTPAHTIRREVDHWPAFKVSGDRFFLLTQSERGLELWSGSMGEGFSGDLLACSRMPMAGLTALADKPVVCWSTGGDSWIDWDGERISVPGIELTGECSAARSASRSIALFQTRGGPPLLVQRDGSAVGICRYPDVRDGLPLAAVEEGRFVAWWLGTEAVRDVLEIGDGK